MTQDDLGQVLGLNEQSEMSAQLGGRGVRVSPQSGADQVHSLSEVKVPSLLDEVPVDLRCRDVSIGHIHSLLHRKKFLP